MFKKSFKIASCALVLAGISSVARADESSLSVLTHIQNIGDRYFNAGDWAGTKGEGLAIEGLSITTLSPSCVRLRYMVHQANVGDLAWVNDGEFIGSRGQGLALQGIAIQVVNNCGRHADVYYSCHIQDIGDSDEKSNGQFCGTRGQGLHIEAIKVGIAFAD